MRLLLTLLLSIVIGSLAQPLQAAKWRAEPAHSALIFFVSHFDLAKSSGRFTRYSGEFDIDSRNVENSTARVSIDVSSLDMGDERFTETMLGEDWFDVASYPQMVFQSTEVLPAADGTATVHGTLQIRDQQIPLQLTLQRWRCATFPLTGRYTCGYSLTGEIDRMQTGMTRFKRLVGHAVELRLEFEIERENTRAGPKRKR